MHCPECSSSLEGTAAVCGTCGLQLGKSCAYCHAVNRLTSRFCSLCGQALPPFPAESPALDPEPAGDPPPNQSPTSERKRVTVLFSDLSGYSALCERLDPEDVREMMNLVFKEIVGIVIRYEGAIDRIIGDEVLAVFGIPRTHEDDPLRAIRAAREIHDAVTRMTGRFEAQLDTALTMHSGIATGMVVTGIAERQAGRHGLTGEPIHRASSLTGRAAAGEILVDSATMRATSGFFRSAPVIAASGRQTIGDAHRIVGPLATPDKVRRVSGSQAPLIGRNGQLDQLESILAGVIRGQGACVFLEGEAGTGKSRLLATFKKRVAARQVQWLQGNAYDFSRNSAYFPIIDLLRHAFDLHADDSDETIHNKLAEQLALYSGAGKNGLQIIQRLFSLSDTARPVPAKSWRVLLKDTVTGVIEHLAGIGPTIICIEDLHWADPSTIDLLGRVLNEANLDVFFLITYRPPASAFTTVRITNASYHVKTILLPGLTTDQCERMARALLETTIVPAALLRFLSERLGGNPFFVEEAIPALVDMGVLVRKKGRWHLEGAVGQATFASGISAVIAAKLDRLDNVTKRIGQEAAVIGRRFSPRVLEQISAYPVQVAAALDHLQAAGLIGMAHDGGSTCYQFNNALIHEVAYKSLLKQERRAYHEKTARSLETQHRGSRDASCQVLAHHFQRAGSVNKALDYILESGRASTRQFAIQEAHHYYQSAYDLMMRRAAEIDDADHRMVELLLEWFFVFNMRGQYIDALDLMERHEQMAMQMGTSGQKGMFLACMGWVYQRRERLDASYDVLQKALDIGGEIADSKVIAYACACLVWTCTMLGQLDEALQFARRSEDASRQMTSSHPSWCFAMDQDLVRFVLTGTAVAHWFRGSCRQCREVGERLMAYGQEVGDMNSISEGYLALAMGRSAAGDYPGAIDHFQKAHDSATDALYAYNALFFMTYTHLLFDRDHQVGHRFDVVIDFCQEAGYGLVGNTARAFAGMNDVARGKTDTGIRTMEGFLRRFSQKGLLFHVLALNYMLGSVYLNQALGIKRPGWATVIKNLLSGIMGRSQAARQAQSHFTAAIRTADRMQALGVKGMACLGLGRLYHARGAMDQAREMIGQSLEIFGRLEADEHRQRAQAAWDRLPSADAHSPSQR